jgi:hypothetical protein
MPSLDVVTVVQHRRIVAISTRMRCGSLTTIGKRLFSAAFAVSAPPVMRQFMRRLERDQIAEALLRGGSTEKNTLGRSGSLRSGNGARVSAGLSK